MRHLLAETDPGSREEWEEDEWIGEVVRLVSVVEPSVRIPVEGRRPPEVRVRLHRNLTDADPAVKLKRD